MSLDYILQLADNGLVMGHRLSEWCGHGPALEQDIALTNTALDDLGRARNLYQYAADVFNTQPQEWKEQYFSSVALQNKVREGAMIDEDDLAYLRDSWDFRNVLLAEQPNGDWANTVARSFLVDAFQFHYFKQLSASADAMLAAIAAKALKEVTYHLKWSSEWVVRLGDGTDESHERMQRAVNELWMFTGELFTPCDTDTAMHAAGIGPALADIKALWLPQVKSVLEEATLRMPGDAWMQQGGKVGRHTEHLGYILTELQFVQRAYPGMEW